MEAPQICGARILLRTWRPQEAAAYVHMRDSEVFRWTAEDPTLTVAEARAAIEAARAVDNAYPFAIVDRATDEVLGNFAVVRRNRVLEVSYWLAPEARGRGATGEALALLRAWAAGAAECDQLELEIGLENMASRRVAEKAGFSFTGERESSSSYAQPFGRVAVYVQDL